MGQALYRKYRPRKFSEAVGQEAITRTLEEAVRSGRISHAYLFSGPRGVGKTSVARILAHQVNQLPYDKDSTHLDIIEIDAASNRRIDEIRDLREKVHITPTSAKYKVYIVDEVHMLTREASNALLKTLEEPPAHCIFILATTEAHKLPETIISRTQRFNFKPIPKNAARSRLEKIAKEEKTPIDAQALDLLTEYSEGSLRDIIGLLDQLSSTGESVTEKDVRELLGIPSLTAIDALIGAIEAGDARSSLSLLEKLNDQAATPVNVARALSQKLRLKLIEQNGNGAWLTGLLKNLMAVSSSTSPQEALELAVLESAASNQTDKEYHTPPSGPASPTSREGTKSPKKQDNSAMTQKKSTQFSLNQWQELLSRVKTEAPSLYTALRLAQPTLYEDSLELAFPFPLHQKKAQEARHVRLIGQIIEDLSDAKYVIKCSVDKELANRYDQPSPKEQGSFSDLNVISNIFGSAEMLES